MLHAQRALGQMKLSKRLASKTLHVVEHLIGQSQEAEQLRDAGRQPDVEG
jgi:hypothetical protein